MALDLANTVSGREDPERRNDHLGSSADLLAFASQSGIVSAGEAAELRVWARQHEAEARRSFRKVVGLREAVYAAFSAVAQGRMAGLDSLDAINHAALEALQHRRLSPARGGYRWQWLPAAKNPLERVLWLIAQSAADLLTSEELKIVRFCEAPDCQWLFLDHSRNRSRRWCDMTTCGNRQKARRHYRRTHR